ncbi:uncharacterized protein LOC115100177 isoform X2 [Rhinatrema bivittatum]|uniref:uncharacterized protein LOC115100177 isoform X2 n=1 Tax=Rhinatrema bivittatum TaxID=194408 RepID=UPI001125C1A7|nr:uncharacterized protein LOC115100177 isoform X2 [Rhinatrema bivittatum]
MLQTNILVFVLGLIVVCNRKIVVVGQFKHFWMRNEQDTFMAPTKEHQQASVTTKRNTLNGKLSFLNTKQSPFGKNTAVLSSSMSKNINRVPLRSNLSETPLSDYLNSFLHNIHPKERPTPLIVLVNGFNTNDGIENQAHSLEISEKIVSGNYLPFNHTNTANSANNFISNLHHTSENLPVQNISTRNPVRSLVVTNLQLFLTFYPMFLKMFDCNSYTSIDRNTQLDNCIEKAFNAYSKYKDLLLQNQSNILKLASEFGPKNNRLANKENVFLSTSHNTIERLASLTSKEETNHLTESAKKKKYLKLTELWSGTKNKPVLNMPQDKMIPHEEEYTKTILPSKKKYSLRKKKSLSNSNFFRNKSQMIHNSDIKVHISTRLSQSGVPGPLTTKIKLSKLRNPWKIEKAKALRMYKKIKPVLQNDRKNTRKEWLTRKPNRLIGHWHNSSESKSDLFKIKEWQKFSSRTVEREKYLQRKSLKNECFHKVFQNTLWHVPSGAEEKSILYEQTIKPAIRPQKKIIIIPMRKALTSLQSRLEGMQKNPYNTEDKQDCYNTFKRCLTIAVQPVIEREWKKADRNSVARKLRTLVSHSLYRNVGESVEDQKSAFNKESARDERKHNSLNMVTFTIINQNERQVDTPFFKGKSQHLVENPGLLIERNKRRKRRKVMPKLIVHKKEVKKKLDTKFIKLKKKKQLQKKMEQDLQIESNLPTSKQRVLSPKLLPFTVFITTRKRRKSAQAKKIPQKLHLSKQTLKLGEQKNNRTIVLQENDTLLENGLHLKERRHPPVRTEGLTTQTLDYTHCGKLYSKFVSKISQFWKEENNTNSYQYKNVIRNILSMIESPAIVETGQTIKKIPQNRHSQILPSASVDDALLTKYPKYVKNLQILAQKYATKNKWTANIYSAVSQKLARKTNIPSAGNISLMPKEDIFNVVKTKKRRIKRELTNDAKQIHYIKELAKILKEVKNFSGTQYSKSGDTGDFRRKISDIQSTTTSFPVKQPSNGENPVMNQFVHSETKMRSLEPHHITNNGKNLENIKNDLQNISDVIQTTDLSFPSDKQGKAENANEAKSLKSVSLFTEKSTHQTTSIAVPNIEALTQRETKAENQLQNSENSIQSYEPLKTAKENKSLNRSSSYIDNQTPVNTATAVEIMNDPLLIQRHKKEKYPMKHQSVLQSKHEKINTKSFDPYHKMKDKYSRTHIKNVLQSTPGYKRKQTTSKIGTVMIPIGFLTRLISGLAANATIFAIIFLFFVVSVSFLLYRERKFCRILGQLIEDKIESNSSSTEELHPPPSTCIPFSEYCHTDTSQNISSNEQEVSNPSTPYLPAKETSVSKPVEKSAFIENTMDKTAILLHTSSMQRRNLFNNSKEEDIYCKAPSFPTKEVPDSRQFQIPCVTENLNDVCKSVIPEISSSVQMKIISDSAEEEDVCNISGNVPLGAKFSSCESITLSSSDVLNVALIPRFSSPLPNKTLMEVMHDYLSSIDDSINIGKHSNFSY